MPNRRKSSKAVRKASLPAEIKIKIEKDCEEEEELVIQNFLPIARFDEQNKIKREAEINYELMVGGEVADENQGDGLDDEDRRDNRSKSITSKPNNEVQVKSEPMEVLDINFNGNPDNQIPEIDHSDSLKIIKYETAVNSTDVEIQISKVDIAITEPRLKRNSDDDQESQNSKKRSKSGLSSKTTARKSGKKVVTNSIIDSITASNFNHEIVNSNETVTSDQDNYETSLTGLEDDSKAKKQRSNKKSTLKRSATSKSKGQDLDSSTNGKRSVKDSKKIVTVESTKKLKKNSKNLANTSKSLQKSSKFVRNSNKLNNNGNSTTESPPKSPASDQTQQEDSKANIQLQESTHKTKEIINNHQIPTINHTDPSFIESSQYEDSKDSNKFDLHSRLSIEDIKDPNLTSIFNKPDIKLEKALKIAQKYSIAVQRKFKCKLCPKSFDKQLGLKNHQAFHSTLEFPCTKCDIVFKNHRNFKNHKCPVCEICGRKFKFQAKLVRHMTYVHADESTLKLYECDLCDKKLRYKISIERHMVEHLEVTKNTKYKCEVCHKTFKKRMGLGNHMILHAAATFRCDRCGVMFKKIRAFKQHKCLICKLCSKLFTSKTKLVDHVRNVHTDESLLSLYFCDICGKSFKYRMSITRHVLDHLEEAKYDCETCEKKFKSGIALRDHIRICHAKELITCKICHKQMKPQCIYQHMKTVHTVVRNFQCKVCDAAFKTKDKLKRHMDTHDRRFKCDHCDRMFSSLYEHTEHIRWHENPDIYQCKVCQKSFATRTSLNTHSKLHKGIVRNLQCPHCPFKTHRKESIKYHLTTHEKREKQLEMKKNWLKCEVCGALLKSKASLWGHHRKVHPAEKLICDLCGIPVKTKHSMKLHMENRHMD